MRQPVGEPGVQHVELQELQHGLQTQRARLHRVLEEVRLEEPLGRVHVLFRAHKAQPGVAAAQIASSHTVEHEQTGLGQAQRALEIASWTRGQIDEKVRDGVQVCTLLGRARQAGLIREGLRRKETETGLHLINRSLTQQATHAERFQDHSARTRDARERRNGAQRTGRGRHLGQHLAGAIEIAEREILVGAERTAHEAGQPTTRLQRRLQQHAEGHYRMAVFREIPGLGRHVVFDLDGGAGLAHAHLALDAHHAAHEVVGRAGQACNPAGSVEALVHGSERI